MTHRTRPGLSATTVLAVLVALAAGAAGGYFLIPRPETKTASDGDTKTADKTHDRITALGRLQPAGSVIPIHGPPGDQILTMNPKLVPGYELKFGEEVATLKSSELRSKEVEVARKQLDEGKAAKKAAQEAGTKRIAAAQAELDQAKANKPTDLAALKIKSDFLAEAATTAARQVERVKKLKADGVTVADEDIEKAELQQKQAAAEFEGAKAMYKKTETTYDQSILAGDAKLEAAKADLAAELAKVPTESGEEKLKLAEQMRDLTTLRAPVGGTVLKVPGRAGQPTGLDPILQIADLSKMTAVAEVYESDVRVLKEWMRTGKVKATVSSPAFGDKVTLTGTAEMADITGMIARNAVFALGPREDADRRVVEVVVHLDDPNKLAAGLVGLQVTVELSK